MSEVWETLIIKDQDGTFYATIGRIRDVKQDLSAAQLKQMNSDDLKKILTQKNIQEIKDRACRIDCEFHPKSITYNKTMTKTQYLKDMKDGVFKSKDDKDKIQRALDVANSYGTIDGSHHKMWVIDQMVRILVGSEKDYLKNYNPEDENYPWDTGVAP